MVDALNLNLLPILHSLIRTRSVTKTAAGLGMSQPAVSRSLAQMREVLSDPLLIKTNRGMSLTKRAEELEEPLGRWLESTRMLLRTRPDETPANFTGAFRIAADDYGLLAVLRPALRAIMSAAPNLRIEVVALGADSLSQLATGAVDIAVSTYDRDRRHDQGSASERELFVDPYRCIMRADHPLLAQRTDSQRETPLTLDEFTAWPHVVVTDHDSENDPLSRRLSELGRDRRVTLRVPHSLTAPHLVAGDAIVVLPSRSAALFKAEAGFGSAPAPIELSGVTCRLMWHGRTRRDPATCWLIQQLSGPRLATDG